ncbi:hypothetical protein P4661_30315 [Priestia megaterium]|uniref:hypothetical protein n=1 Tax=Priestia megaterium TaxID=1404 RepID=UPI002453488D|nr:hypothetical protein [Priestia megaterium]MDH3161328.1 hypothetical protein [Priestia megaterium]MED4117130.1 hypothetical protein [Priestia megaterium]
MAFKKQLEDYRFNLNRNRSWKYTAVLLFFFIGFLSLLTSKFYLKTEDPLYHTNTYESVSSNITGTVTIENRVYHPASSSLDMVIKMDQTDEEEVCFVAQEKANPNIKLPVHLLYEDDGYYVVRISDLSPNWEALAFDLYQENEEKETVNVDDVTSDSETDSTEEIDAHALITTLYSDQRKTKSEEGKGTKSKEEYALLVNDLEKQFVKKKMKNYEKAIMVEAKHKRQTQQEVNELQRDMKYQVNEEKADTESKIAMKKDAIQSSDESIQLYKDEQKSLQEKLRKLNEKQQDLAMK